MLPTTRESTLAEHLKLVEMINRLTSALLDLARDIKVGDTEYYEDAIFFVGNQQKWDTFVKERSRGYGSVAGHPAAPVVALTPL